MTSVIADVVKEVLKAPGALPTNLRILQGSFVALVVAAAIAFFNLFTQGHAAFNTNDYGITWGLPIATYLYLVLTATGLTFVASFSLLFGFTEFYPVAKRCVWLSVAALVAGFTALALEIGHPFRMLWALPTGLQYVSPMFWMGVFYTLYLVLLLWKFQRIHAGDWDSPTSKTLGIASFVSVVIAHSTLGFVFGMMTMRPMWYDGLIAVYFLVMAAVSGAAFTVFFTYLAYNFDRKKMPPTLRAMASESALPNVFATLIGLGIMMVVDRTVTGLWSNMDGLQVHEQLIRSPLWHFALWGGLVVPFVLMLSPSLQRQEKWQICAAALVIVGMFIVFYQYVVGGQQVPMFKGAWMPGLIEYTPSFTEWMLTVIAIALVFFIYAVGERLFKLSECPGWWK